MNEIISSESTLISVLMDQIRSTSSTNANVEKPHAILWTDPNDEWRTLIPSLRREMPELLMLGEYDPENRTGPAIWLRCMIDGKLDHHQIPDGETPVVYLPQVGRQHLRAGETCPDALKPLVELMYRGALWLQKGGHDWTSYAFLTSKSALGLDVKGDTGTKDAILRSLDVIFSEPLARLQGTHLEAQDFDKLHSPDIDRELLMWLNDPQGVRNRKSDDSWEAFRSLCCDRYDFDPEEHGETVGGEKLGCADGSWLHVWRRFEDSPKAYSRIPELLRRSKPNRLDLEYSHWPDVNEQDEETARQTLQDLKNIPHNEACSAVLDLEKKHSPRRGWVWYQLELSPIARVLEPLSRLARHVKSAIGGQTPDEIAQTYLERGWQADQAAWQAVAQAGDGDRELISTAVNTLYSPWLEKSAREFQGAVEQTPLPNHTTAERIEVAERGCLLFADGLRYDLGVMLQDELERRGCQVQLSHRWAALPTVTATAKPAVSPVAAEISGGDLPADFAPAITSTGKQVIAPVLRAALEEHGFQLLTGGLGDIPQEDDARGWVEAGKIDSLGHKLEADLARHLNDEISSLAQRVEDLLDAGWSTVRVVTDHGWLLLPDGMPKVDLPTHLTASKWARCATISGDSQVQFPIFPWHWNGTQQFVSAPGIACFTASNNYSHGGVSVQECLIPDLLVVRSGDDRKRAVIETVKWVGMRCYVVAQETDGSVRADIRLNTATGESLAASAPKKVEKDGSTSLLLEDDQYESSTLVVVLLDDDGNVLSQHKTKVGNDS